MAGASLKEPKSDRAIGARKDASSKAARQPMLKVTGYDRASALVLAAVIGLAIAVGWLLVVWAQQHEWRDEEPVPLEIVEVAGGVEDGEPNETLELKTPYEEVSDPALVDSPDEETEFEPTLDSVVDLAEQATDMARQQLDAQVKNTGRRGSSSGTGRPALGLGNGEAGLPREQRWFVSFASGSSTAYYARQLDFFKIELGTLQPGGRLAYVSNLSTPKPTVRSVDTGANQKRLYMTWQGSGRRLADLELFKKAGITPGTGPIFHFYPAEVEQQLAKLERKFRGREPQEIRRTYFAVQQVSGGFEFVVTRQAYLR